MKVPANVTEAKGPTDPFWPTQQAVSLSLCASRPRPSLPFPSSAALKQPWIPEDMWTRIICTDKCPSPEISSLRSPGQSPEIAQCLLNSVSLPALWSPAASPAFCLPLCFPLHFPLASQNPNQLAPLIATGQGIERCLSWPGVAIWEP